MIIPILIIFSYFGSQVFGVPGYVGFIAYLVLITLASYLRFKLGEDNSYARLYMRFCKALGLVLAILGIYYIVHGLHDCNVVNRQCVFQLL